MSSSRGPFEWPIRAFMVELTLSCLVLLVGICVLAGQIARLEDRVDYQQRQIDGVYCQLDPAPQTAAGVKARRDICGDQP